MDRRWHVIILIVLLVVLLSLGVVLLLRSSKIQPGDSLLPDNQTTQIFKQYQALPEDAITKTALDNQQLQRYQLYGRFVGSPELKNDMLVGAFSLSSDPLAHQILVRLGMGEAVISLGRFDQNWGGGCLVVYRVIG